MPQVFIGSITTLVGLVAGVLLEEWRGWRGTARARTAATATERHANLLSLRKLIEHDVAVTNEYVERLRERQPVRDLWLEWAQGLGYKVQYRTTDAELLAIVLEKRALIQDLSRNVQWNDNLSVDECRTHVTPIGHKLVHLDTRLFGRMEELHFPDD